MLALTLLGLPTSAAYAGVAAVAPRPPPARSAVLRMQLLGADGSPASMPGMPTAPVGERPGQPMDLTKQEPAIISEETYGLMLSTLLKTNESVSAQISANYAMIDYAFLQKLDSAIDENDESKMERLHEIKGAVNEEMARRMQEAATTLREVVQSPTPVVMDGKIAAFARQGKLDDALLQLLEANLQQAQQAGEAGAQAAAVLGKLQGRVRTELDAKLSAPQALLRRLLRMDDKEARTNLLREKMASKKKASVVLVDSNGKQDDDTDTKPDVDPRTLAQAITELKARFGNVDEHYDTGFVKNLLTIAEEAEAVALDLAGGKELTSRQQQDLAWDRGSVSVWDLEAIEEEAHQEGKLAMWEQEAQEQFARQDEAMRKKSIDMDWENKP